MATQPEPKPNRIEPIAPPETPSVPSPSEEPQVEPDIIEPAPPNIDPGPYPDEF